MTFPTVTLSTSKKSPVLPTGCNETTSTPSSTSFEPSTSSGTTSAPITTSCPDPLPCCTGTTTTPISTSSEPPTSTNCETTTAPTTTSCSTPLPLTTSILPIPTSDLPTTSNTTCSTTPSTTHRHITTSSSSQSISTSATIIVLEHSEYLTVTALHESETTVVLQAISVTQEPDETTWTPSTAYPKTLSTIGSRPSYTQDTPPTPTYTMNTASTRTPIQEKSSVVASTAEISTTNSFIVRPTSSISTVHRGASEMFRKHEGAIIGSIVAFGIIAISLVICILVRHRTRRLNHWREKTADESAFLHMRGGGPNGYTEAAVGTKSEDVHRAGHSPEPADDDAWSYHSNASSQGMLEEQPTNFDGSQEYASSYPVSLLPAYSGKSASLLHSNSSRVHTLLSHDSFTIKDFYQDSGNESGRTIDSRV